MIFDRLKRVCTISAVFFATSIIFTGMHAQTAGLEKQFRPPRAERFAETDAVAIPQRDYDLTCNAASAHPRKDCPIKESASMRNYTKSHVLSLYGGDGELWYEFDLLTSSPAYFANNKERRLRPLGDGGGYSVFLRMVRESRGWYEVVANERTGATAFIRRDDPLWRKATWSEVFDWSRNVAVDQAAVKLRDAPDGKVIAEYEDVHYNRLKFIKLDGDWMYVEGIRTIPRALYYGWIRWREGRNILVCSVINNKLAPITEVTDCQ